MTYVDIVIIYIILTIVYYLIKFIIYCFTPSKKKKKYMKLVLISISLPKENK